MLDVPLQILRPQVMEMDSTERVVVYGQLNSRLMRKFISIAGFPLIDQLPWFRIK